MPFIAAMLKTLGSGAAAPLLREACARNLARLVTLMAEEEATIKTPPHKASSSTSCTNLPVTRASQAMPDAVRKLLKASRCLRSAVRL